MAFFAVVKPHSLVNPPLVSQEAAFLFVAHAHKPSSFLVYDQFCCLFFAFLFYEIMTGYLSKKGKTLSGINSG